MKDLDARAATRNGFLVSSSDEDALGAIFAGAWTGSKQITLFEGLGGHHQGKKPQFDSGKEMNCKLVLDMDKRTAELRINGVSNKTVFTESVTSINSIGFAVRGAKTLFTVPEVTR